MRTQMQNAMSYRRRGKPAQVWPEQVVTMFESTYGDRAVRELVWAAAHPLTLHSHVQKYLAAVQIIIHRDLGRARVARSLTGETV